MAQPSPFPTSCSSLGTFRAPTPPCRSWSPPQPATAPTPALDRDLRHRGLSGRPADPHSEGREGRTLTALCCTFTTAPPPAFRRWTTPRRHSRSTWPTAPQNAAHRSPDSRLVLDANGTTTSVQALGHTQASLAVSLRGQRHRRMQPTGPLTAGWSWTPRAASSSFAAGAQR
jgi:hypothetical protein